MPKIIYEFYYVVGDWELSSYYKLIVDRETEKMLYGDVFEESGEKWGRFAINKSKLNCIHETYNSSTGTIYRVQVDDGDYTSAYNKAKDVVYKHLLKIAERFRSHEEDNQGG
jgi:glycyl-tRNA synthetase alpha subunit